MKSYFALFLCLSAVCVFILLFSISSNCYAVSYDDLQEYVNLTASYYPNNQYYQHIKNLVNENNFKNQMPSGVENYNFFYVYSSLGELIYFTFYNATSYNISANSMRFTGTYAECRYNGNNNSWNVASLSNKTASNSPLGRLCI